MILFRYFRNKPFIFYILDFYFIILKQIVLVNSMVCYCIISNKESFKVLVFIFDNEVMVLEFLLLLVFDSEFDLIFNYNIILKEFFFVDLKITKA